MKTYYLRTTTEQELHEALEAVGLATREYDPADPNNQRPDNAAEDWDPTGAYDWRFTGAGALDIIGKITEPTGNTLTDEAGNEYPEMQEIPGFHANLLAEREITGLPEVEIETTNEQGEPITVNAPATPRRKFAGE